MANTYTLISSNVLTGSAASVTFSSIPSTYTDLIVRYSARSDRASQNDTIGIQINSDSATNYSITRIVGTGSAATSSRLSAQTSINAGVIDAASSTTNTFSSNEIYLPSYTVAQSKPMSIVSMQEDNAAAATMHIIASLWSNNAVLTSIVLTSNTASNFVSGSSFYLYGLKSS